MSGTSVSASERPRGAGRAPRGPGIALLTFSHVVDDFYQGAVPALLPFIAARGHFGYAAVAGLTFGATMSSSVAQPLFGMLADRYRMAWLVGAGMSTAALGIALSGTSQRYEFIWLALALAGLGIAAYHPESARIARIASRGSQSAMGYYHVGGNLGIALAPVVISPVVYGLGFGGLWILALPAWITALLLRPRRTEEQAAAARRGAADRPSDRRSFALMTVIVIVRSAVYYGLTTFLTLYVTGTLHGGRGFGEATLTALLFGGVVGTVLGGHLAGRFGRLRVLRVAYALCVPAVLTLAFANHELIIIAVIPVSLCLYVPFSIHTTLGQDYLPQRMGTAAGVTTGLTVSAGGLLAPAFGVLGDATSLRTVLLVLGVLPLLALAAAAMLREPTGATIR
ncbi:MFS transporter [Actinomadura sp. NEAU-AAG7]|uniref:MFS transporter n=1 Tax=Actinomadura sp. NEAU-AAG7 TaxID=2839640 RepID=UPI001BE3E311|nr:MFS transporter [Actinomadura sp. NEAU-AAG7]MBT2212394.1 MFS transporter [Actinomadura sp. NEAU-AAG7]